MTLDHLARSQLSHTHLSWFNKIIAALFKVEKFCGILTWLPFDFCEILRTWWFMLSCIQKKKTTTTATRIHKCMNQIPIRKPDCFSSRNRWPLITGIVKLQIMQPLNQVLYWILSTDNWRYIKAIRYLRCYNMRPKLLFVVQLKPLDHQWSFRIKYSNLLWQRLIKRCNSRYLWWFRT